MEAVVILRKKVTGVVGTTLEKQSCHGHKILVPHQLRKQDLKLIILLKTSIHLVNIAIQFKHEIN